MKKAQLFLIVLALISTLVGCKSAKKEAETFNVGIVSTMFSALDPAVQGFKAGLAERGYTEGKNITYLEPDLIEADVEAITSAIQELVDDKVDLLFTLDRDTLVIAKQLTAGTDVSVVFSSGGDLVQVGIVESVKRPGGNVTGVSMSLLDVKSDASRLEWLLRIKPGAKRVYLLYNPDDAAMAPSFAVVEEAAAKLGVTLVTREYRNEADFVAGVENVPQDVDAWFTLPDSTMGRHALELVVTSMDLKLPLSTPLTDITRVGGLMSYGSDRFLVGGQIARLADQVLQGADPGSLPLESPEIVFAINLKTAETIGLDIPDEVLQAASEIVR